MNCFRWGLDNRIHGAASSSGGSVYKVGANPKSAINLRGSDFSFDPKKFDIRRETGGAQHGMCFDDFGNKYVCSNSDHAQAILFEDRYLKNNPYFAGSRARKSIAVDGGQAPVFRQSPVEPWRLVRTRLRVAGRVPGPVEGGGTAAGYFTGSTGITVYRGNAGSVKKGTAIIGDVGSNIVHRKTINRNGLDITATRIDKMSELVSSTDIWFRPVQFGNAPDGCLYILDMYREVIEHPKSLPPMIKKHLDLTFGRDRGRIYRLGKPQKNKNSFDPKLNSTELVKYLNHPNSWHRETAARLLFERQDITSVPALQTVRVQNFGPEGRIHALWTLFGLRKIKLDDLLIATLDADPNVRRHAILIAEKSNADWLNEKAFQKLERDPDTRVKVQLAFSLGMLPPEERETTLWRLFRRSDGHPVMTTALMSSSNDLQLPFLNRMAKNETFLNSRTGQQYLALLVNQIVRRKMKSETDQIINIVENLVIDEKPDVAMELSRSVIQINPLFRSQLLSAEALKQFYQLQFDLLLSQSTNNDLPIEKRLRAISNLNLSKSDETRDKLMSLVSIAQPLQIQLAAISTLGQIGTDSTAKQLIKKQKQLGLESSNAIKKTLLSNFSWTKLMLENSKASEIGYATLQLLSKSSNRTNAKLAAQMLAKHSSFDLGVLIKQYDKSLTLIGDINKGKQIFEKNCSKCHKAGGIGFEIGPNLATMKARGKAAILANVLDPNREVNPSFINYLIETSNGKTTSGMIASESESTLTLKQEQNKVLNIPKSEIDAIKSTGLSLMPVGLEKDISIEQMADLLEFLMNAN